MARYRDRSAVPDWALLALMATAMACGGEQAKLGPDQRTVPVTSPTPNDATGSTATSILAGARVEPTGRS